MIYTLLTVLLFLTFIVWREIQHDKIVEKLTIMARARNVEEFSNWKEEINTPIFKQEPSPTEELIEPEEMTFEQSQNLN